MEEDRGGGAVMMMKLGAEQEVLFLSEVLGMSMMVNGDAEV